MLVRLVASKNAFPVSARTAPENGCGRARIVLGSENGSGICKPVSSERSSAPGFLPTGSMAPVGQSLRPQVALSPWILAQISSLAARVPVGMTDAVPTRYLSLDPGQSACTSSISLHVLILEYVVSSFFEVPSTYLVFVEAEGFDQCVFLVPSSPVLGGAVDWWPLSRRHR